MLGWYLTHMDGRIMYVIAWNLLFNKQRQVEQHTGLSFIWNTSINHAVRGSWGKSCVFCVPGLVHGKGLATRCQPPAPRCLLRGCFTTISTPMPCPDLQLCWNRVPGLHGPGTKAKIPFVWSRGWTQHFLLACSRRARSGLKYGLKSVQHFR